MTITDKKIENGEALLTIEVPVDEVKPFLERASQRIAKTKTIAGFRPGKAPLAMVMMEVGAMTVHQEALQEIIASAYWKAIQQEKLNAVGQPDVTVEKLAPGNPVVFKAVVSLMPEVTLTPWRDIVIEKKPVTVSDAEVEKVLEEFRAMQATEALVERAAAMGDKVEVNFEVKREGVVIEGGNGRKFPIVLGRSSMIPGFEEQILGLKAGEKKEFSLTFPTPYMQESLAGKEAQFSVDVIAVYERTLPQLDDAWAQKFSGGTLADFKKMIHGNLETEKQQDESRRREQDVIEKLISRAKFSSIPPRMITSEVHTMLHELQDDIRQRGMEWQKYLQSVKKTEDQMREEMRPFGEKRVKAALTMRALARELAIVISDTEIEAERDRQRQTHKDNEQVLENINRPEFKNYISVFLQNKKVMEKVFAELKLGQIS